MAPEKIATESNTPSNVSVLNKYKAAGDLANRALLHALTLVLPGASIYETCRAVDAFIGTEASKLYTETKMSRGVAFPCCISVNEQLCTFSPVDASTDRTLKDGDLVKVELGAQFEGYPALVATTVVIGASTENPVTGVSADIVDATAKVAEATIKLLQAGKSSWAIAADVRALTRELGFAFAEGIISHTMSKDNLANYGEERILLVKPTSEQSKMVSECTFKPYDVIAIDICLSSGSGKMVFPNHRPTIYKRTTHQHSLRLKTSRAILADVRTRYGGMAFNLRDMENLARARVAVQECCQHQVMTAYEVLQEQEKGKVTARVMLTVMVQPDGSILRLTDFKHRPELFKPSPKAIQSEHLKTLIPQ